MPVMTGKELAGRELDIALNYKTKYMYACYGFKITDSTIASKAKQNLNNWYTPEHIAELKKVANQTPPVWGFDCVNLTKGILWGWIGDESKLYGGAKHATNGVPDTNANGFIQRCYDVTTDFSRIEIGEGLWIEGHWGLYVGDGLAVECTGRWKNGVQVTAVHNIGKKSGYNGRVWTKHGKLPWVTYEPEFKIGDFTRTLCKGMKGDDVRLLQEYMLRLGYSLPKYGADGDFGSETMKALKIIQNDMNLEATGTADAMTLKCIITAVNHLIFTPEPKYCVTIGDLSQEEADRLIAMWPQARVVKE